MDSTRVIEGIFDLMGLYFKEILGEFIYIYFIHFVSLLDAWLGGLFVYLDRRMKVWMDELLDELLDVEPTGDFNY